jgi:hypothetical protein
MMAMTMATAPHVDIAPVLMAAVLANAMTAVATTLQ